jgi:hydroxymethylglutaryl-CoA reductase (NADPH)
MSTIAPERRVHFDLPPTPPESPSLQIPLDNLLPTPRDAAKCLCSRDLESPNTLIDMIAASFLPSRFRGEQPATEALAAPSWINRQITPVLQAFSTVTSSHPIQTIVIVALLASSTYVGLLQESIFDAGRSVRKAEWSSLVEGSRRLRAGEDTAWKWQAFDDDVPVPAGADNLALLTLVFPESTSDAPQTAPLVQSVPFPENLSITAVPSTSNAFTAYSQDSALAFSVPYDQASQFLTAAQEIPNDIPAQETRETEHGKEKKMWIMKAARVQGSPSIVRWLHNAWIEFIDLLKSAETLDIMIMLLGYISMHLTFVSLFVSMRRMGSKFWLATSVLFSSVFAFLFGLIVTTKLGVPISMVLLSEGLPFLVVTIGFEKNIVLTRAVLSHAVEHRRTQTESTGKDKSSDSSSSVIQSAIQRTIKEKGFEIVKDYAIEILILVAGAASGVQGGLQQFCFLAAWILFFDCILLFTFYTAILCIKLEINRIKRHVEMRRALEDDGVSKRVAENVAQSNDWPRADGKGKPGTTIFGRNLNISTSNVPKFKVIMVVSFILFNAVNICFIPFRSTNSLSKISSWAGGLGGVITPLPVDPFKVASNGLDAVLFNARTHAMETVVTVLAPIKYELEFPSVHYDLGRAGLAKDNGETFGPLEGYGVAGRIAGGILKSLEDPVLSKWIVVALTLSVALNGYLFNAARWGIKDPNSPDHPINPKDLAEAQRFNESASSTSLAPREFLRPPRSVPSPPASTDDEGDLHMKQKSRSYDPELSTPNVQRSKEELDKMLAEKRAHELSDEEIVALCVRGKIPGYALEKTLKDFTRAVKIRRAMISRTKATADLTHTLERSQLPYAPYNWEQVHGACCENVIGFMPLPVGVAGPLVVDGQSYFIPMATTEGVLVASASRGCKAINCGGGAVTVMTGDGMTRGPCVTFETLDRAGAAKAWLDSEKGQQVMKKAFDSTSRFARLQTMKTALAGTNLYIRFKTKTGDAMGMNMISKGVEHALSVMANEAGFDDMNIVSVSGNYCIDKKAAAINWIDGRGKGVVAEAIIPADIVKSVLKTDVDSMVELNINKNLIGSAMAGAMGGFNAHAANIVAAMFIATGQDPAQVVESSNCITIMKK